MMKKLLITAFAATLFTASFGQSADLELKVTMPATDTTHDDGIEFTAQIKNLGPTNMVAGDTIFYGVVIDGTLAFNSGFLLGASGLSAGDSLSFSRTLVPATHPTTTTYQNVCILAIPQTSYADTGAVLTANNSDCYILSRSLVSTPENTLETATKVFVANGMLNLASTSTENITFTVMSINGQVVSQGNFTSNRQVDMNGMAKGIYAVVLSNGTERVTKKVAIQ
jgi:hypothetical protein